MKNPVALNLLDTFEKITLQEKANLNPDSDEFHALESLLLTLHFKNLIEPIGDKFAQLTGHLGNEF